MENTMENMVINLPIDKIMPNPYQPRRFFERESLEELAVSIQEYGVLQPISVRLINGRSYELVAGERRLRASKIAGLLTIPALVVNITDQESAILAIIENIQRQNLNFLEEAEGLQNLINDYSFTQEEVARRVGKNQSTVANKLRILKLPKSVQRVLIENNLTERHGRALLRLTQEEDMLAVLQRVIANGLTVAKTEELVETIYEKQNSRRNNGREKNYIRDIRIFTNTVKEALNMMMSAGVKNSFDISQTETGYDINIRLYYA